MVAAKQAPKRIKLIQDVDKPVEKDVLATAIVDISKAARALNASGLNRLGIVILLAHSSKVPQTTVKDVLDALEQLARDYTR